MSAASSGGWGRLVMAVLWLCALAVTVWVAVLWTDLRTTKSRYDYVAAHFGTGSAGEANDASGDEAKAESPPPGAAGKSDEAPADDAAALNAGEPKQDENKKDGEAKQPAKQDEKKVEKREEQKEEKKEEGPSPQKLMLDEQIARVTKENMFVPYQPPQMTARLLGVIGDEVFMADEKFYKVGGTAGGAKVTAIGPDWVDLQWQGKTIRQWVYGPRDLSAADKVMGFASLAERIPEGYQVPADIVDRIRAYQPPLRATALEAMPQVVREQIETQL